MNYGIIYKNKKEWEPARYNFEKSIALLRELNLPYYLADSLRQFGLMLAAQGTIESQKESRKYLKESLTVYESLNNKKYVDKIRIELDNLST
jgi:hypothetical protein